MPRIARLFLLLPLATLTLPLAAALPELSSIEPLEFDEQAQRLVAKGDARLDFQDTRLQADRITYYQEYSLADALGNVSINTGGHRIIADRLSFDIENSVFAVDVFRTGEWPFYLSGASAGGTTEDATIQGATLYHGNPGPFGLSVSSDNIQYYIDAEDDDARMVKLDGATFRIGRVPVFYLPSITHDTSSTATMLEVGAGLDSERGMYVQTASLFSATPWLRLGANLDVYSKRGLLIGPTAQYAYDTDTQSIVGAISTGYIKDDGDTSEDVFDKSIDEDRGFVEWRHKHHIGERITITSKGSYWSDSEVTRDFREDLYRNNQQPDTFLEGVYAGDNYYLSAFARFRPNDFELIQERLPELRYDLLPIPVFETGAYQSMSASYARLREDFGDTEPQLKKDSESDRFDLTYRVERPFALTDWLTLTPLAGARVTHYENQEIDPAFVNLKDDQYTREIYEVGFDLEARAYATYPTVNKTWGIDSLRHQVRPVVRYRYYSDPDSDDEIATIDRQAFDMDRPLLDLSDLRNVDTIQETHLTRLGVENLFQTREEGYGSRTLAELNFYQDVLFETNKRYDGDEQDTFHATWIELVLSPAPWLKFDIASRFQTEDLSLEELRTRTTIKSGDIWELGLSTDLLNDKIEQYRLDFIYRVNERYSLLTEVAFDAETSQFTETSFGVHTRIGSTWELIYALTFREDASREADVEFTVRVRLKDM